MSPPRPNPPQHGPRQGSSDDLESLRAIDAAEARAKAAMSLATESDHRANEAEQRAQELAQKLDEERLRKVAETPVTITDARSMRPGVHIAGPGWKLGIPFTVLIGVAPLVWAAFTHMLSLEQQVRDLNKAVAGFQAALDASNKTVADNAKDISGLHTTVAQQSGYLARVLPMAGVAVPGAEFGALQVDIDRDPDPVGVNRKPRVVTHTRVPAPAPLQ